MRQVRLPSLRPASSCRDRRGQGRSLLCGAIAMALLVALPAAAQDAAKAPDKATAAADGGDTAADAKTLDSVVVTGSRIRRNDALDGPTPLTVIGAEQIRAAGYTEIADVVNQLPSLALTQTSQTGNLAGNPGINALDLRGMGTQRTLVLVDGRRQVPAIPGTSAVDVSNIPSSLVERVEVITGGASALYGADAVTGVANFILKKDFQGVDASARYGASSRGDMRSTSIDALFGRNFADNRGNVTVYGFYEREPDSVSGQDRPWTAMGYPMYTRNNRNQRYWISDNNRNINNAQDAQLILGGRHYAMTADGRLRAPVLGPGGYVNAAPLSLANPVDALGSLLTDGGEYGGRYDSWYLSVPSDRFSSRATFNFDFSDSLRLFANVGYSQNSSRSAWRALSAFGSEAVPADSPFITDEMRAANGGAITDGVYFARHFDDELGQGGSEYRRRLFQGVVGLEGDFSLGGRAWNYAAYYSYGRTRQRNRDIDTVAYDRYYLAVDSTTAADGSAICRSTLDDPGNGCVPLNPFKRLTAEEIGYLRYNSDWATTTMTQQVLSAYASGGIFDLPGGEAQIVFGGEYRKERNDIGAIAQYDPANPAYDATLGTTQLPLRGQYDVKELYSELHLPLLAGKPFAERLGVDAAVRVSDYNTAGRTVTNKFGIDWSPIRDITLRGTYGKAVRAPNIGELYTASSIGGMWITDPCNTYNLRYRTDRSQYAAANCAQLNPSDKDTYWLYRDIVTKGNLDLGNETAKTRTVGVVLRPRFLEDFSLSVDYYNIDLRGAIDSFPAQTIINKCVDAPTLDNQFCSFVGRDAGGNLLDVITQKLNLSRYLTRGVDFAAQYRYDLAGLWGQNAGALSFDLNYTRLIRQDYTLDPDQPDDVTRFAGVFGSPQWKGVLRSTWSNEHAGATWSLRHIAKMRTSTQITDTDYQKVWTGNVFYSDVSGYYRLKSGLELFGGITNAFDRAPPRVPGAEAGGANFELGYHAGVYDVIGRMYYGGIRLAL